MSTYNTINDANGKECKIGDLIEPAKFTINFKEGTLKSGKTT